MLRFENRLRASADFAKCYQSGKTRHGEFVLVRTKQNKKPENRYGVVVSKKISKRAVIRNRIKRRIVAILRDEAPMAGGNDVVIVVKPTALTSSPKALREDIIRIVKTSESS